MLISEGIPKFSEWVTNTARHEKLSGFYATRTLELYKDFLTRLMDYLHNCDIEKISLRDLEDFILYINVRENPPRRDGKDTPFSGSTLQKYRMAINLFFDWATPVLKLEHRPDENLPRPKRNSDMTLPFDQEEIHAILDAICREIQVKETARKSNDRSAYSVQRPTKERDLAFVLVLLDTGLTVSRACALTVSDFLPAAKKIRVFHEKWKDQKANQVEGLLAISETTCTAVSQYLAKRTVLDPAQPLFTGRGDTPLTYNAIRCLFLDLRQFSGVGEITGGRFESTFAVNYLDSGGDSITLKYILGHEYLNGVVRLQKIHEATKKPK